MGGWTWGSPRMGRLGVRGAGGRGGDCFGLEGQGDEGEG